MDLNEWKDRVALVTGAAQGIGKTIARALAERGSIVAAADQNADGLDELVSDLKNNGLQAAGFPVDVGQSEAVARMVERIERDLGPICILINNAGLLRTGEVQSFRDEDWAAVFAVNATGVFNVSRAVSRHMMARRSGSIVTVSSNAAAVPRMSMAAYAASKAAATHFTRSLGLELARYNIRCNVVSPGSTDTPMQRSLWSDENGAESVIRGSQESFKVGIPLQRIASPADIADAVLFLVSDKARHITMHDLRVDGGATLGV